MQVDNGWLAITAVCALVFIACTFLLTAGLLGLVLKVKRLVRTAKSLPERAKERSRVTRDHMREHGRELSGRARQTGNVLQASLNRIKGAMDETGQIVARQPIEGRGLLRRLARRGGRHGRTGDD
jgi:hypothetical protein